jgi:lysophospholipase L1-like esterase
MRAGDGMNRKFTALLLAVVLLSSCNQLDKAKELPVKQLGLLEKVRVSAEFIPRNLKVVAAGDSLTQGVGDSSEKGGYLPYLESLMEKEKGINQVDFYNYGVRGDRSDQLLKRLQQPDLQKSVEEADLIILTIGGNDIMQVVKENISNLQIEDFEKEKDKYQAHLTQIVEKIKMQNPEAPIILVGLYNPFYKWFSDVEEMDEIVANWNATAQKVLYDYPNSYFVEVDQLFTASDENLLYTDYFHPNDKGYALIADSLFNMLAEEALANVERNVYSASKEGN